MNKFQQEKVRLVWLYHIQRPRLCINLLREIAEYLNSSFRLLGVCENRVSLYVAPGKCSKTATLSVSLTDGTRHCWLNPNSVLFVGGGSYLRNQPEVSDVFLLDTLNFSVVQQASISEVRFSPGLIHVQGEALVFGGYNGSAQVTCEKYIVREKAWDRLPSMKYPRYSFSPVHYMGKVYLPCIITPSSVLEAFVPAENRFEEETVQLPTSSNCSLAFMYEGLLVVLSCNNFIWYWNVATNQSNSVKIAPGKTYLSSSSAVVVEGTVYWVGFSTGELDSFNLPPALKNKLA